MRHHSYKVIAGLAAVLSAGAVGVASAAVSPASAPAWRSVFPAGISGQVTAVATARSGGKTTEFAFVSDGTAKPAMYSRIGTGPWIKAGIAGAMTNEGVVSAATIGPNELLAFTSIGRLHGGGRVLKGTGHTVALKGGGTEHYYTWSVLGTFAEPIGSASVLAANDIWLFGNLPYYPATGTLGVWHYNGHTWKKVASYPAGGPSAQVSTDGHGGVWIPMSVGDAGPVGMLHYVNGSRTVTKASLPGLANSSTSGLTAIANIPGTTQELAGGWILKTPNNFGATIARVYQYN